jgi:hypothetical protein
VQEAQGASRRLNKNQLQERREAAVAAALYFRAPTMSLGAHFAAGRKASSSSDS